ncbi:Transcriptional regulatory protein sin3 [Saitoella coloradoensis]
MADGDHQYRPQPPQQEQRPPFPPPPNQSMGQPFRPEQHAPPVLPPPQNLSSASSMNPSSQGQAGPGAHYYGPQHSGQGPPPPLPQLPSMMTSQNQGENGPQNGPGGPGNGFSLPSLSQGPPGPSQHQGHGPDAPPMGSHPSQTSLPSLNSSGQPVGSHMSRPQGPPGPPGGGLPPMPGPPRDPGIGYRPLNVKDALSYLDQVKIQFSEQPDVYNKFLDIMKDFKSQSIDTPGVIERVSTLFRGHPNLVQGFNTFLPPGYRIEASFDPSDPNIRVTTPMGTTTTSGGAPFRESTAFYEQHPSGPSSGWQEPSGFGRQGGGGGGGSGGYNDYNDGPGAPRHQDEPGPRPPDGKKAPVEFNHAINYVNKIKNRFANEPDTYKNFLEILQTYQKEQKPIGDVYEKVQILFRGQPDLLDDFKQFLPEVGAYQAAHQQQQQQQARLPPVGNFAPPAVPKDKKKRSQVAEPPQPAQSRTSQNKRSKHHHKPSADLSQVTPTLTPAVPEPIGPPMKASASAEELAFFDRVKKYIGNKQTYNEFLKVLNLFSQEILDKNTLLERVEGFIGGNRELIDWFKRFVGYDGRDDIIENIPTPGPRIDLAACKAFGPSYRQLPKSETLLPCSGRDEMCWEVLNDEWVSHPTWASEDSGFVAHRKNQYEEALHKIEEERYEYDLNIEANLRTIQLLEPIAQRISNMSPEERNHFKLPPGLGGQSVSIYQKVIKKVYDRERGLEVIEALHENPSVAVPIVLKRLKLKDEEWKRAQREWNKVWRDTEAKSFYKSLDHQGITFKATDKKTVATKNLIAEIEVLRKEQQSNRMNAAMRPRYQIHCAFEDKDVILDIAKLIAVYLGSSSGVSASDREKIDAFVKQFIPMFFSMPNKAVAEKIGNAIRMEDDEELEEDGGDDTASNASASARGRGRDLLKDVLKRGRTGKSGRKDRDSSSFPASKESTPEPNSLLGGNDELMKDAEADDENAEATNGDHEDEGLTEAISAEEVEETWIKNATSDDARAAAEAGQGKPRTTYNLFGNSTLYSFFRLIQILYNRLNALKQYEDQAAADIRARKPNAIAVELGINHNRLDQLEEALNRDGESCYSQLLKLSEKMMEGDLEQGTFEECVRYLYGTKAFRLYTVDRVVAAIVKQIATVVSDAKGSELIGLFEKDRKQLYTTPRQQIVYRVQVETLLGPNENTYRMEWNEHTGQLSIQLLGKDDMTLDEATTAEEQWRYYIDSYVMSSPTEGVSPERVRPPFLRRDLPDVDDVEELIGEDGVSKSGLEIRICVNTYKVFFLPGSEDVLFRSSKVRSPEMNQDSARSRRVSRWKARLEGEDGWKKGLSAEEVAECEQKTKELFDNTGAPAQIEEKAAAEEPVPADDVEMGNA